MSDADDQMGGTGAGAQAGTDEDPETESTHGGKPRDEVGDARATGEDQAEINQENDPPA